MEAIDNLISKAKALGKTEVAVEIRQILSDNDKARDYPDLVTELWELVKRCGVEPRPILPPDILE
ncbi:MAG TPA: hypothetical protein PKW17_12650 [Smithellaceae bacterium]|nr:hypothetical protein [Smithellaceae bacterium]